MAVNRVWIEDGCTVCGLCADECPVVFRMENTTAEVREEAAPEVNEECVKAAAEKCPVDVIKYE